MRIWSGNGARKSKREKGKSRAGTRKYEACTARTPSSGHAPAGRQGGRAAADTFRQAGERREIKQRSRVPQGAQKETAQKGQQQDVLRPEEECKEAFMKKLRVENKKFYLGDEEFQLRGGSMHYVRTHPDAWRDRLLKLKACGLNTVETYVPWNLHEPREGEYNFEGFADIERFLRTAAELDLYVILRPGPYICAEWEFGGFPAWLLTFADLRLRTTDAVFLEKMTRWFSVLIPKVLPYLSTRGGPILAIQVENEYGSYGCDKDYLRYCKELLLKLGVDVLLFTSDGGCETMLNGGTLDDVLPTVNFGSHPEENFAALDAHAPEAPHTAMEYWCGWFDHWGEEHHARSVESSLAPLRDMVKRGENFNIYMFHGGTNFGFYNGSNFDGVIQPTVTSYDYDAFLTESGNVTAKGAALRELLAEEAGGELPAFPAPSPRFAPTELPVCREAALFSVLDRLAKKKSSAYPLPMETYGQNLGLILYRCYAPRRRGKVTVRVKDPHDLCFVFVDGKYVGFLERDRKTSLEIDLASPADPARGHRFDFLVENLGRVNYGENLFDRKGVTYGIKLDYQFINDFEVYNLDFRADRLEAWEGLDRLLAEEGSPLSSAPEDETTRPCPKLDTTPLLPRADKGSLGGGTEARRFTPSLREDKVAPRFYQCLFEVEEKGDSFISTEGLHKGLIFINGFLLGRFWEIGPQRALYMPKELLREGENSLVILDYLGETAEEEGPRRIRLLEETRLGA